MIDQQTIDKILDAAKIVEVVSDFVTLRKRGVNYIGLCPFHNEKTPSFSVSEAKGICKCFSCGKGGNAIHFIMEHEQLSYYEAAKYLAKKYNIEIHERELTNEEKEKQSNRESMFILNGFAQKYFSQTLTEHQEGIAVGLSYYRSRGFRDEIIRKFQLGYSTQSRDALAQIALKNGYQKELLIKTGLCSTDSQEQLFDRYRERVIFPIHGLSGKIVAFGGRILKKADNLSKYINSPESDVYHKSNELYGIYFAKQAIVKQDLCYLVEGYTDVLSMNQSGIENVVASSGTALTPGQIRLIRRFTNNICVLYDGDAAGIKASIRGIDLLLEEDMNVKVVLLPNGEDPDSFAQKHNATELISYLKEKETDFIRFKTQLLLEEVGKDPIKRSKLINEIIQSISLISNVITRSIYIKECSDKLDVEEQTILNEVAKILNKRKEKEFQKQQAQNSIQPVYITEEVPTLPNDFQSSYTSAEQEIVINSNAPQAKASPRKWLLGEIEKEVLKMLLRYGEQPLGRIQNENGEFENLTVCEFIGNQLEVDELTFNNLLYQKILEEALHEIHKDNFQCTRHFISHPDNQISQLAVNLISSRYNLTKVNQEESQKEIDRLNELIPRLVLDLKNEIVTKQIETIQKAMKTSLTKIEVDECLVKLNHLYSLRAIISKSLGDRVVLKL